MEELYWYGPCPPFFGQQFYYVTPDGMQLYRSAGIVRVEPGSWGWTIKAERVEEPRDPWEEAAARGVL